ncbi:MAG: calcium/sodium antiporter [Thaumarchaeota archaeon]|nr:calcium/sodium antiporter [Nitrososphaerota archaeon]
MALEPLFLFFVGLASVIAGAESLVKGASRLAGTLGLPPVVIGLTVVAYGTSTPELTVSIQAALAGRTDIAVGNVVGSNIFNVLFTLGSCALILPLAVSQQIVRRDVPIMVVLSLLLLILSIDEKLDLSDGILLLSLLVAFTILVVRQSRKETTEVREEYAKEFSGGKRNGKYLTMQVLLVIVGLGLLVAGTSWVVDGAVAIAKAVGISELIIGLTIIAAGTSLPEVATSILATLRKERDIAVGNIVGSNIYNILAILGLPSVISANGINVSPALLSFDIPVMITVAIACIPIFFKGTIARWEGAIFLGYYFAYVAYLILEAAGHDALPFFSNIMLGFVIPLTGLTLLVTLFQTTRKNPQRREST